jgi:hypothetical protein
MIVNLLLYGGDCFFYALVHAQGMADYALMSLGIMEC